MSFIWPAMLVFLLLIPLFVVLYVRLQERRRRQLAQFAPKLAPQSAPGFASGSSSLGGVVVGVRREPGVRQHIPPILFLAGLTILILALARPQSVVSLPRVEGTVILAFDVSGSMAASDLEPNRMEAAKAAARDFVQRQPSSVQIGIVAFSDGGLSVQAPTSDQETILAAINRLEPQRSTSIGHGILASLDTIAKSMGAEPVTQEPDTDDDQIPDTGASPADLEKFPSAAIILLTDGENTAPPDPLAVAQAAAEHEVRIYTVGIGSTGGAVLEVEGFTVHTQLDEAMLQQIARISGGEYYHAGTEEDLLSIYKNITPQLVVKPEKMEVTSLFAGAGLFVLLLGAAFSLLWFNRMP